MRFNSPLAHRLFWTVFIFVTVVTYIVMPVTAMYFMRDIAIKAVAAYREEATADTVDKLVGLVLLVSKIGWIPLLINSIFSLALALVAGYLVSRPTEGMHRNIQDLIHDLRGPISGIVGDAEIAIDLKKDADESLHSILAKAEALLGTYDLNAVADRANTLSHSLSATAISARLKACAGRARPSTSLGCSVETKYTSTANGTWTPNRKNSTCSVMPLIAGTMDGYTTKTTIPMALK